jgi:hypothetical protein
MGSVKKIPTRFRIQDAEEHSGHGRILNRKQLINKLNFINFQDETLQLNFVHTRYRRPLTLNVIPQPCLDAHLFCRWSTPVQDLAAYDFSDACIASGGKLLRFTPELIRVTDSGIEFRLPDNCSEITSKALPRHRCSEIETQLIQSGAHFRGRLIDFNAMDFRIELTTAPPQSFGWINPDFPVNLIFSDGKETLFSGECTITRHRCEGDLGRFSLRPTRMELQRFGTKEFRSSRHALVPSPYLMFRHPFTGHTVHRNVIDVSGSGFSVEEDIKEPMLLPGMILPEMEFNFAGSFRFTCKAQVVYRKTPEETAADSPVRCGLALLDIGIDDHTKLLALLHHARNRNCYVCNRVDLDALWDFFFETGFIYPEKYAFILANKEKIKSTYDRLYNQDSTVARHFTYQDNARILGHIAMLRFYNSAWLIHHHAGNTAASARAGLDVLNQIGRFTYDSHRLRSIHMDYLICYFRPVNKFPSRVFGRITQNIQDPKGSSIDTFAYFHFHKIPSDGYGLPDRWRLHETVGEDLKILKECYEELSGGLMLQALSLQPQSMDLGALNDEYRKLGFRRERHLFSLKKDDRLAAIIMANVSDIGLNLSDLTSSINVLVVDPGLITRSVLERSLMFISELYVQKEIPVMLFPANIAETLKMPLEKFYSLWILNTLFSDHYFRHLKRLLKFVS